MCSQREEPIAKGGNDRVAVLVQGKGNLSNHQGLKLKTIPSGSPAFGHSHIIGQCMFSQNRMAGS